VFVTICAFETKTEEIITVFLNPNPFLTLFSPFFLWGDIEEIGGKDEKDIVVSI